MEILIDSREQTPLDFTPFEFVEKITVEKLNVGDYGCRFNDGYELPIYFERKSLEDLFGTMGKGNIRFKKEIRRAQELQKQLILIVEKSLTTIQNGCNRSQLSGQQVLRTTFTLWSKYWLVPVFCRNRVEMATFIYYFFESQGKEHIKKKKSAYRNVKVAEKLHYAAL